MQDKRKNTVAERVVRDLERAFPNQEPDKHRYIVEANKYSFYVFDSRPPEGGEGEWTKLAFAKLSYHDGDKVWQLSWMPPQGRWQKYGRYFDVETASLVIKGDPMGCFMGKLSPLANLKKGGGGGEG